ncbi:hypothetical protein [Sporolactobacillus laevolacticus]|uniref:hypothetical protein n=1 Tax=Sporolactobacillus laevolacticus TaxID=33018 RepID=UPI0025B3E804|nr:hypothetical protein [Sporolactobacillus laevolacticus]MDN3955816.1 hypothetical protein [Sporolactobacillus laevolacticus]
MKIDKLDFKSLLKNSNGDEKWYPTRIESYRQNFKLESTKATLLQSNLAYSFQYLEYIIFQLSELSLSAVLTTMLYKSFIITGMSIVEATFLDVMLSHKAIGDVEWEELTTLESNSKKVCGIEYKTETKILKRRSKSVAGQLPTLDSMIKKMEKKQYIPLSHDDYPVLKSLRELRNKVHLQSGKSDEDTDYKTFNKQDFLLMKRILFNLFGKNDSELTTDPSLFKYLNENN